MDALDVLPLGAAKEYLNENGRDSDSELQSFIEPAVRRVERHLGQAILTRTVTETVPARSGTVWLTHRPVLEVTAAARCGLSWPVDNLTVDSASGVVRGAGWPWSGVFEVTYLAGRVSVTDDEVLAVKVVLGEYWRTQRSRVGGRQRAGGAPGAAVEAESGPAGAAPLRVRLAEILGDTPPVIA